MASFFDQAQAIWKALDQMREQDPEGYQKFITDQLEEGSKIFGATTAAGAGQAIRTTAPGIASTSTLRSSSSSAAGRVVQSPALAEEKQKDKSARKSVKNEKQIVTDGAKIDEKAKSKANSGSTSTSTSHALTDDVFQMSSLLSTIVSAEQEDNESECSLKTLKLPGEEAKTSKGKEKDRGDGDKNKKQRPLIEEL